MPIMSEEQWSELILLYLKQTPSGQSRYYAFGLILESVVLSDLNGKDVKVKEERVKSLIEDSLQKALVTLYEYWEINNTKLRPHHLVNKKPHVTYTSFHEELTSNIEFIDASISKNVKKIVQPIITDSRRILEESYFYFLSWNDKDITVRVYNVKLFLDAAIIINQNNYIEIYNSWEK